jgi:hypothetical protein
MTTNHLLDTTVAEPQEPAPTPRLVPPPPVFAWRRLDPFNDRFELWAAAGTRPLAWLTVGGQPVPSATVEAEGRRYLLTAKGVGDRRVVISDAATDAAVVDFEWRRVGRAGTLRLAQGGQLHWRRTRRWRPTFTLTDRFGTPLLRLSPDGRARGEWLHPRVEPSGSRGDLPLLLALGWFLLLSSGAPLSSRTSALGSAGRR